MISQADRKWLVEHPPEPLYYGPAVDKIEELPEGFPPWTAIYVKSDTDLYIFAFDRWSPFREVTDLEIRAIAFSTPAATPVTDIIKPNRDKGDLEEPTL